MLAHVKSFIIGYACINGEYFRNTARVQESTVNIEREGDSWRHGRVRGDQGRTMTTLGEEGSAVNELTSCAALCSHAFSHHLYPENEVYAA